MALSYQTLNPFAAGEFNSILVNVQEFQLFFRAFAFVNVDCMFRMFENPTVINARDEILQTTINRIGTPPKSRSRYRKSISITGKGILIYEQLLPSGFAGEITVNRAVLPVDSDYIFELENLESNPGISTLTLDVLDFGIET